MPILYYKADTLNTNMTPTPLSTTHENYIYNYLDNDELVALGLPWEPTLTHPLSTPKTFYDITKDKQD